MSSYFDAGVVPYVETAASPVLDPNEELEARRATEWYAARVAEGRRGVYSVQDDLNAARARVLLDHNPNNRRIKQLKVDDLAADITSYRWDFNGESLKVSREGDLNDGQHRCHAIIKADLSVRTMFTFGLERDTRLTLDQQGVRTPGDYLGMEGVENANNAAATIAMLIQYDCSGAVSHQSFYRPTKTQVKDSYVLYPDLQVSIRTAHKKGAALVGGVSVLSFCHYVLSRSDRGAADAFIKRLIVGDNLAARDPIFLCRDRFLNNRRMKVEDKVELIFRTWNAHRQNKRVTKIQTVGGPLPQLEA